MYCKHEIKKQIEELTPANLMHRPSNAIKHAWLTAPSKKIHNACLKSASHKANVPLDSGTAAYFGYCWTQVGRYSNGSSSSLDVAMHTGIPALIIAIYMDEYGLDWSHKLFESKRIVGVPRGKYTILRIVDVYATAAQIGKVLLTSKALKTSVFNKMIEEERIEDANQALLDPRVRPALSSLALDAQLFTNGSLKGDVIEHRSFKAQAFERSTDLEHFGDTYYD